MVLAGKLRTTVSAPALDREASNAYPHFQRTQSKRFAREQEKYQ
jgi:hypothetical protein